MRPGNQETRPGAASWKSKYQDDDSARSRELEAVEYGYCQVTCQVMEKRERCTLDGWMDVLDRCDDVLGDEGGVECRCQRSRVTQNKRGVNRRRPISCRPRKRNGLIRSSRRVHAGLGRYSAALSEDVLATRASLLQWGLVDAQPLQATWTSTYVLVPCGNFVG